MSAHQEVQDQPPAANGSIPLPEASISSASSHTLSQIEAPVILASFQTQSQTEASVSSASTLSNQSFHFLQAFCSREGVDFSRISEKSKQLPPNLASGKNRFFKAFGSLCVDLKSLDPTGGLPRKFLMELCEAILNSLFDPAILDDFPSPWQEFIQVLNEQDAVAVQAEARSAIDLLAPPKPMTQPQSLSPTEHSNLSIRVQDNSHLIKQIATDLSAVRDQAGPGHSRRFMSISFANYLLKLNSLSADDLRSIFHKMFVNFEPPEHTHPISGIVAGAASSGDAAQADALLFADFFLSSPILRANVGSLEHAKDAFVAQCAYMGVDPNSLQNQLLFLKRTNLLSEANIALKKHFGSPGSPKYPPLAGNSSEFKQWRIQDVLPLPSTLNELVGILVTHNHASWSPIIIDRQRFPFNSGPASSQPAPRSSTALTSAAAKDNKDSQQKQPFRGTSPVVEPNQGKATVAHGATVAGNTPSHTYEAPQCRICHNLGFTEHHWHNECPRRDNLATNPASSSNKQ